MDIVKENAELSKKLEAFYTEMNKETWDVPCELIPLHYTIEQAMELEAYKRVVKDGRSEIIAESREAGAEVKSEIFPYKTKELRSGIEYELSEYGWLVIHGIVVIEGTGDFKMSIPSSNNAFIFNFVANGKANLLSPMGVIVPPGTTFVVTTPNKEKQKYKIVGVGYNNPEIGEIGNLHY